MMTLKSLQDNIKVHNIPDSWYSIDDGLKPDALILYKNYDKWEFFYLDEKGERNMFKIFTSAYDAYQHLWMMLAEQKKFFQPMNAR